MDRRERGRLRPARSSWALPFLRAGPLTWLCPIQSLMLAKAKECWEQEHEEREAEKARYLAERIPTLQTRGLSLSALQVGVWGRAGVGLQVGDGGDQLAGALTWLKALSSLTWSHQALRVGATGSLLTGGEGAAGEKGLAWGGAELDGAQSDQQDGTGQGGGWAWPSSADL